MDKLSVHRGYPVPWFVAVINGEPDFRVMDPVKWRQAAGLTTGKKGWTVEPRASRCWVCGGSMLSFGMLHTFAFTIGPMCAINRVSAEPPSHVACAEWSARNCPFLSRPQAKRREVTELPEATSAGVMIERNPGVTLIWKCGRYVISNDGSGKPLIQIGTLTQTATWWAEGRPATREEVLASFDSGYPLLEAMLAQDADPEASRKELERRHVAALALIPR